MEKTLNGAPHAAAPTGQITMTAKPAPDGSISFYFVQLPVGTLVGSLKLEAQNGDLVQAMLNAVTQWMQQQKSGIALAGADALAALKKASSAN